jgi:hypothetical protein
VEEMRSEIFSRPLHGLDFCVGFDPSTRSAGLLSVVRWGGLHDSAG